MHILPGLASGPCLDHSCRTTEWTKSKGFPASLLLYPHLCSSFLFFFLPTVSLQSSGVYKPSSGKKKKKADMISPLNFSVNKA